MKDINIDIEFRNFIFVIVKYVESGNGKKDNYMKVKWCTLTEKEIKKNLFPGTVPP